jgi:hypothetical protein
MIRRMLAVFALALALAPAASAQTVDEIITRHIAARGGMEKIKAIQTVRMTGKMTVGPGFEAPMVMEMSRPDKMKMQFTIQGMTGVQAYDGKVGWSVMPFMGKKDPEAMSADDVKELIDQSDIDGPLVDWKAKGHKLELLGKESVEGTDAYKLKLTMKSGTERIIYLDADNFLEIKNEGKRTVRGTELEFEGTMGDFKPVAGVLFPYSMENSAKGHPEKQKLTVDSIAVNVPLAADYFTMPAKPDSSAAAAPTASAAKPAQKAESAAAAPSTVTKQSTTKKATGKP